MYLQVCIFFIRCLESMLRVHKKSKSNVILKPQKLNSIQDKCVDGLDVNQIFKTPSKKN